MIEDYKLVQYYLGSAKEDGGDNDTLRFGAGVTRDRLHWSFVGEDLIFTLQDSPDDSLTIKNYTDNNYAIENIEVDGSLLTTEEIFNLQFDTQEIVDYGAIAPYGDLIATDYIL